MMENLKLATVYTGNNCSGEAIVIPVMPIRPELAEAYIPYQLYSKMMSPQESLKKGTIFQELIK
ncbi:MAG: spore coat associated protein CotJA [Clostridia bacterium]|nr:spore coat associated protein CotJA [Clostridia bacterium]